MIPQVLRSIVEDAVSLTRLHTIILIISLSECCHVVMENSNTSFAIFLFII